MSVLLCPKCGQPLKWTCGEGEGEAYCSALQSRELTSWQDEPSCYFEGKVRRVSPSDVELVPRERSR